MLDREEYNNSRDIFIIEATKMHVITGESITQLSGEHISKRSYEDLLWLATDLAVEHEVSYDVAAATFGLIEGIRAEDEDEARELLVCLPHALDIAHAIDTFYGGAEVDYTGVFATTLLHDIGKLRLDRRLMATSRAGNIDWGDLQRLATRPHAVLGAEFLRESGFPQGVYLPVGAHHSKQKPDCYGYPRSMLNNSERISCDAATMADFGAAMMTRTNSRNRKLSTDERLEEVRADAIYVVDDYTQAEELGQYLANRVTKHWA